MQKSVWTASGIDSVAKSKISSPTHYATAKTKNQFAEAAKGKKEIKRIRELVTCETVEKGLSSADFLS